MTTSPKDLQFVLDRIEIEALFIRFCEILDQQRDFTLLEGVFTADVVADWPRNRQTVGLEAFIVFLQRAFYFLGPTHHHIGNFSATIDGDSADASVRLRAYHAGTEAMADLYEESLAYFEAHAVRTADGWRLDHWRETIDIVLGTRVVFRDGDPRPNLGK